MSNKIEKTEEVVEAKAAVVEEPAKESFLKKQTNKVKTWWTNGGSKTFWKTAGVGALGALIGYGVGNLSRGIDLAADNLLYETDDYEVENYSDDETEE